MPLTEFLLGDSFPPGGEDHHLFYGDAIAQEGQLHSACGHREVVMISLRENCQVSFLSTPS
jgi:hypothetical protein